MLNACFPSGSLGFCMCQAEGAYVTSTQETPWALVSNELLWQTFHTCCYKLSLEELSTSCVRSLGVFGSLRCVFLAFDPCACTFHAFVLYPFTAINLSHKYEYMLSAVNPTSEFEPGSGLGNPDTAQWAVPAITKSWWGLNYSRDGGKEKEGLRVQPLQWLSTELGNWFGSWWQGRRDIPKMTLLG